MRLHSSLSHLAFREDCTRSCTPSCQPSPPPFLPQPGSPFTMHAHYRHTVIHHPQNDTMPYSSHSTCLYTPCDGQVPLCKPRFSSDCFFVITPFFPLVIRETDKRSPFDVTDNTNADIDTRAHWVRVAKEFNVPIRCVRFTASTRLAEHNDAVRALNPGTVRIPPFPHFLSSTGSGLGPIRM